MDDFQSNTPSRHAKMFALLRQEQIRQRPAAKAKAATQLLDDKAAEKMIERAVRSLHQTPLGDEPDRRREAAQRPASLMMRDWIKRTRLHPDLR